MDETPITNKQFGKFVRATYYETEAEQFGWSFVLISFVPNANTLDEADVDPESVSYCVCICFVIFIQFAGNCCAYVYIYILFFQPNNVLPMSMLIFNLQENWVAVDGAYWRSPEGPGSSYKLRENHPVVHVSHHDASEYCKWMGKRLPGEREWEAAARAGHWGPKNRTLYSWGDDDSEVTGSKYANTWQGKFPWENSAVDGWRGTSPVKTYPPNKMGFYDMTGNVWEWMRGGKHKERIIRGGSYVDTLDGSANHAATLGARATLHGTTGTGNVGFRCVKPPKRRTEYMWVYHGEEMTNTLEVEDADGNRKQIGNTKTSTDGEWIEDDGDEFNDDKDPLHDPEYPNRRGRKKMKVVKPRTRLSNEL